MATFYRFNLEKSRRLGISLSGTGKELAKRPYAPGQHGPNLRKKTILSSGFTITMKNKNFVTYTVWMKKQFRKLFDKSW